MAETISTDALQRFVGGEAEVQDENENYLYRGEIASIGIEKSKLKIRFAWLAKNQGGALPHNSLKWDARDDLDYEASLALFTPSEIGQGRIAFGSYIMGEILILFPADGSKMDPQHIEGLPEDIKARQAEKFRLWNNSR